MTSDKNVHLQYHAMLFATFLWDHAYAHVCVNAYWLIWIYNEMKVGIDLNVVGMKVI